MKLSELVNFKNELDRLSVIPAQQIADQEVAKVTHLVETFPLTANQADNFNHSRFEIKSKFAKFEQEINELKLAINLEIEQQERPWFQESYRLYDQEMRNETTEYILSRRMNINPAMEEFQKSRLQTYSDWRHPAMIIRPGNEIYMQYLVGCDPLYIVDQDHDLLAPAISQYPIEYQRRLRPYVLNERNGDPMLTKLPNNQFGLVFAYNYFNFRPIEVIKQYLNELYEKLKPGGILIMTFNDCDRDKAVMLVENHFCCYTPGKLIFKLAESIGYEIIIAEHDSGPSTWLELKKPGTLTSIKGGQTLAKIVHKSVAKSK